MLNEEQIDLIARIRYIAQLTPIKSSDILKLKQSINSEKFSISSFDENGNELSVEL